MADRKLIVATHCDNIEKLTAYSFNTRSRYQVSPKHWKQLTTRCWVTTQNTTI